MENIVKFSAGALVFAVFSAGCTLSVRSDARGDAGEGQVDAASADAAPGAVNSADAAPPDARPSLGPFGTPTPLSINSPEIADDDPSATGDLRELYFNRPDVGGNDIFVARRDSIDDPFGPPTRVAELSSDSSETTPRVSYDGLAMVFASSRPGGGGGGNDLWIATRESRDDPWSDPVALTALNSAGADLGAGLDATHTRIIFHSDRSGDNEIYEATRPSPDDPFNAPVLVDSVNSASSESSPFLTGDARAIFLASDRDGNADFYTAIRPSPDAAFGELSPLAGLNGDSSESDIWISPDERLVLFTSDRSGESELYQASR